VRCRDGIRGREGARLPRSVAGYAFKEGLLKAARDVGSN
jgi:hypothetical protein